MNQKTALLAILLPVFLLSACGQRNKPFETVQDTVIPVMQQEESGYTIMLVLPDEVAEQTFSEDGLQHVYVHSGGDYEIVTEVLRHVGLEDALRSVTGQPQEQLTVLKTQRFGMPEYRTSWYSMTEEGGRTNRASLFYDGAACYCVSFSAPEDKAAAVQEQMEQIFEAMTLYTPES